MLSAGRVARCSVAVSRSIYSSARKKGYQQANVVILPSLLANDFEAFCRSNPAPLPLLYRSQSGETSCDPLATDADIRSDIPQYCVYEEGQLVKTVSSLQSYSGQSTTGSALQAVKSGSLSDMVSFYLGCSFGFEGKLKEAGIPVRNVDQGRNVSMYRLF
uniref:Chromosome 14 open reading frame 159 n=1 Tax=Nothobranchius kadleci TaxID=1051664 RepID=A0A1A8CQS3_NOTKA